MFARTLSQDPNQCTFPQVLQLMEADARWNEMESSRHSDPTIFSMVLDGVVHIRIAVRYTMNFRTSTMRQNRAEALVKTVKKADEKMLAEEAAKLGSDLNKFGSEEVDFQSDARAFMASGSQPHMAFADAAATIPDIRSLLPEKKKKDDAADGDDDGDDDDDDDTDDDKKKPKRGDPDWWARDEFVLSKEAEISSMVKVEDDKFMQALSELRTAHKAVCVSRV